MLCTPYTYYILLVLPFYVRTDPSTHTHARVSCLKIKDIYIYTVFAFILQKCDKKPSNRHWPPCNPDRNRRCPCPANVRRSWREVPTGRPVPVTTPVSANENNFGRSALPDKDREKSSTVPSVEPGPGRFATHANVCFSWGGGKLLKKSDANRRYDPRNLEI